MAAKFIICSVLCAVVGAAPPAPPRLYHQPRQAQLQQINPYEYYIDNPDLANYYSRAQPKEAATNNENEAPARLESLEPDSEVELIPGAQQPQQPPQQTPVSPNLPGLVPGQRVFIVHMPVPGYRPGTIGGYQPVYIVAAAPQGNGAFSPNAVNGYQNTVLLNPSGQAVISPVLGYPRQVTNVQQPFHPGYLLAPQFQTLKAPLGLAYQNPNVGYQPAQLQQVGGPRPVHLSQLIALQTHAANAANNPAPGNNEASANSDAKQLAQLRESNEVKDTGDQQRRNGATVPAHTQPLSPK